MIRMEGEKPGVLRQVLGDEGHRVRAIAVGGLASSNGCGYWLVASSERFQAGSRRLANSA